MNVDRWFDMYRDLPGLFVAADEVAAALDAAPGDIDTRRPADDTAFQAAQAAQAAGTAAAWWQRWSAGEDVPPAPLNADSEIRTPDDLYAWLLGYEHAAGCARF